MMILNTYIVIIPVLPDARNATDFTNYLREHLKKTGNREIRKNYD